MYVRSTLSYGFVVKSGDSVVQSMVCMYVCTYVWYGMLRLMRPLFSAVGLCLKQSGVDALGLLYICIHQEYEICLYVCIYKYIYNCFYTFFQTSRLVRSTQGQEQEQAGRRGVRGKMRDERGGE